MGDRNHDPSFDLLFKWLFNLELIPSSQRQNDNGESQNLCIVFGHLWTLTTSYYNLWNPLR